MASDQKWQVNSRNGNCKQQKKVWWTCDKGHEWKAPVSNRNNGRGCPYCSGRFAIPGETDLATANPKLATEWHPTKNGALTPKTVAANSDKKVWWLGKCSHEWEARIGDRSRGNGCPICAGKRVMHGYNDFASFNPELTAEWHPTKNGNLLPQNVTCYSNKKVWWVGKCGHEWEASIADRSQGHGCPICAKEIRRQKTIERNKERRSLARMGPTEMEQDSPKEVAV